VIRTFPAAQKASAITSPRNNYTDGRALGEMKRTQNFFKKNMPGTCIVDVIAILSSYLNTIQNADPSCDNSKDDGPACCLVDDFASTRRSERVATFRTRISQCQ